MATIDPNKVFCSRRHTFAEHMRMEEAKASAELAGAKTGKSVCDLIDMANEDV